MEDVIVEADLTVVVRKVVVIGILVHCDHCSVIFFETSIIVPYLVVVGEIISVLEFNGIENLSVDITILLLVVECIIKSVLIWSIESVLIIDIFSVVDIDKGIAVLLVVFGLDKVVVLHVVVECNSVETDPKIVVWQVVWVAIDLVVGIVVLQVVVGNIVLVYKSVVLQVVVGSKTEDE